MPYLQANVESLWTKNPYGTKKNPHFGQSQRERLNRTYSPPQMPIIRARANG